MSEQPPKTWPGLNEGLGLPLSAITLGLAQLKTEGERFVYDIGANPGRALTRWERVERRLAALVRRLRDTPSRVWWALFGRDDYYDDGGW